MASEEHEENMSNNETSNQGDAGRDEHAETGDPSTPMVVGIGASAGGLGALKELFSHVPEDSGLAFVVVVHLSPEHESHLADLLQPHSKIPIEQVSDNVPVEANHAYVIPPNQNLSSIDSHLRLSQLEDERTERAPIDHFFTTLSDSHDGHAIGVVLTGTGSDGALGLRRIKERGGFALVQDPTEAEFDGMPQSAIATGMVDVVLPVAEIPARILRFARTRPRIGTLPLAEVPEGEHRRVVEKILAQVRARTSRDFSRYKRSTILRRIARRMQIHRIEELSDYLELLREDSQEVRSLADEFLITVTEFFRDPEVFETLQKHTIPALFERKSGDDQVRVWSVGCATGEEAYTLAILLHEESLRRDVPPNIQVFASDLHESSLKKAREGVYPETISANVSSDRLKRYFTSENGGYRVRKELRELVVFTPHNLLSDPPFSKLDLIACRNVLIYLERDIQHRVIRLFHYALHPGGSLLVGTSESVDGAESELFRPRTEQRSLYEKRDVPSDPPELPVFPLSFTPPNVDRTHDTASEEPTSYGGIHQKMVEQVAPPSLLVSEADNVMHLSEHAGRYLVHPGGRPTSNVFQLVREDLRIELRAALRNARQRGEPVYTKTIDLGIEGETRSLRMDVRPGDARHDGFALVIFDEREPRDATEPQVPASPDANARELEAELDLTKQGFGPSSRSTKPARRR